MQKYHNNTGVKTVKKFLAANKLLIIGVLSGAIFGYFYYHFVGCTSGSCAITSKPMNSTLYGALMGGLLLNLFKKQNKQA